MPVLFVGHGSPMNAVEDTRFSRAWQKLGDALPRPRAILAVSAHWELPGTWLTAQQQPPTIHDFGGFPRALFEVQYPAPGSPDLVAQVERLLAADGAKDDEPSGGGGRGRSDWGLDHGTWSVLRWIFPDATVPVVQLSLDTHLPAKGHLDLAQRLAPLRDDGVLIVGSGNITHNLRDAFGRMRAGDTSSPAWAERFDADVARAIAQHDSRWLVGADQTDDGRRAHSSREHWLPLLYAHGASSTDDAVAFPVEGLEHGLSMRAVRFG